MSSVKGKKIIVTGGAGAIGHATACVLAGQGADVLLVDIDREALDARRGAVAAFGTRVEVCHADVSKSAAVQGYVAAALKAFGRIDGLFSNAGIEGHIAPTHEYDEDEFDRVQRGEHQGRVPGHAPCAAADDRAGQWQHRQHRLHWQRARPGRRLHLQRDQACGGRPDAHRCGRGRRARACASTA